MPRTRRAIPHAVAGTVALIAILTFWISTVATELSGSAEAIVAIKRAIPWGLLVLIPALAITGGTGNWLARGRSGPVVRRKRVRMIATALIGLLVLVPCVLYLGRTARVGALDAQFYGVQAVELVAGAANISLLVLNMLDGLRMTGRLRSRRR